MDEKIKEYREIYNSCWKLFLHVSCVEEKDWLNQMQLESIQVVKRHKDSPFMKKLLCATIEELCNLYWTDNKNHLDKEDLQLYRDTYVNTCNLLTSNVGGEGKDEEYERIQNDVSQIYKANPKKITSNLCVLTLNELENIFESKKPIKTKTEKKTRTTKTKKKNKTEKEKKL